MDSFVNDLEFLLSIMDYEKMVQHLPNSDLAKSFELPTYSLVGRVINGASQAEVRLM